MGVYYYFHNSTTKTSDITKTVMAKFNYMDDIFIINTFKNIIDANGWQNTDVITSYPDYPDYPIVIYSNNTISYQDQEEDTSDYNDEYLTELNNYTSKI